MHLTVGDMNNDKPSFKDFTELASFLRQQQPPPAAPSKGSPFAGDPSECSPSADTSDARPADLPRSPPRHPVGAALEAPVRASSSPVQGTSTERPDTLALGPGDADSEECSAATPLSDEAGSIEADDSLRYAQYQLDQLYERLISRENDLRSAREDNALLRAKETHHQRFQAELQDQIGAREKQVSRLDRTTAALRASVDSLEEENATLSDKLRKERSSVRKHKAAVQEALSTADEKSRQLDSLQRKYRKLETKLAQAESLDSVLRWLRNGLADEFVVPTKVATAGDDPFSAARHLDVLLENDGHSVYHPGGETDNEDISMLIVGRVGWDEERLEAQLAAREGKALRVYSQELFLLSRAVGRDALVEFSEEQLLAHAKDHPALKFLVESELHWPNTHVEALPKNFDFFGSDGFADESPLTHMGYRVGITHGLPPSERKRLLTNAFRGPLPAVQTATYMQAWGRPNTRRRLWRMAHHLQRLAALRKTNSSQRRALGDWAEDLRYLEKEFYRPWMRFAWPSVDVPSDPRVARKSRKSRV